MSINLSVKLTLLSAEPSREKYSNLLGTVSFEGAHLGRGKIRSMGELVAVIGCKAKINHKVTIS